MLCTRHKTLCSALVSIWMKATFVLRVGNSRRRGACCAGPKSEAQRLGWRDEVKRLDLARFEADIDEAQRLLGQLDQGANGRALPGQMLSEGVPKQSMSLRQ